MKLFVTVGAQMPFDRLIAAIDAWARDQRDHQVFAQIGESELTPSHLQWTKFLDPAAFDAACDDADAMVGHAGIGTIFAALERGKPLLIMPREAARQETRNDHQVATARRFAGRGAITVARDEHALAGALSTLRADTDTGRLSRVASGPLIDAIASFIDAD